MKYIYYILPFLLWSAFLQAQDYKTEKAMLHIRRHAGYKKALKNLGSTTRLYIKQYADSVFPNADILQFKNLVSLNVGGISISKFKASTTSVPHVRIDTLKLKQLPNLRYLALDGFDFSDFPEELCSLNQLKGLSLGVCKIKALPPSISKLSELRYLQLRANELVSLPKEFSDLQNLEVLDLCNNKFTLIPPQITGLKVLRNLDLSNVESDRFMPATPQFPMEINVNTIDYMENYETLRRILSSEKMKGLYGDIPKNVDCRPLFEKLRNDRILSKTVFCKGPRQ